MGFTVRYKGLTDGPTLIAGEGRYPAQEGSALGKESAASPTPPGVLHLKGNPSELRQTLRTAQQERVLDEVYRQAAELSTAISQVHVPPSDDLINTVTAVSSQPQSLSATADELASTPARHTLDVHYPAQVRTILSKPQNPVEEISLADGEHSLTFTVDGEEHTVTVAAHNTDDDVDTQEEFLGSLARAINVKDSRVHAEVVYGEEDAYDPTPRTRPMNRTVRLEITGTGSGAGVDFYLADDGDGTLAADYGLDAAPPRRQAFLSTGGATRTQESNTLELDDGHVQAGLLDSTRGTARIDVSKGPEVFTSEMAGVISRYNQLVRYMDANSDLLRVSLKDRVVRPLEDRAGLMGDLGLRATPQGRLEMREDFGQRMVANMGGARGVLVGAEGWTGALKTKLDQILDVDPQMFAADLTVTSPVAQRRQAWDLVESLTVNIVDGYY